MNSTAKWFLVIGALNGALVVALGAFGAHALKARLAPELLAVYQTGIQYHMLHALGLLGVGLLALHLPDSALLKWSGWLMLAGIVLFSGSLYLLAMTGLRWLGAVTPIGGMAFIVAWCALAVSVARAG